jgi:hypothetical protein
LLKFTEMFETELTLVQLYLEIVLLPAEIWKDFKFDNNTM